MALSKPKYLLVFGDRREKRIRREEKRRRRRERRREEKRRREQESKGMEYYDFCKEFYGSVWVLSCSLARV